MSYGRQKIYTDAKEITAANVVEEVRKAYTTHQINQIDIEKLWKCYRGETNVLKKTKEIRKEINHKINENRAYEIVKFHKGYVFGEPIQYIRRENSSAQQVDDVISSEINALNGYMADAKKPKCDDSIAEWMYIDGLGYRLTLANKKWTKDSDESPLSINSLDPAKTFIVYSNDIEEIPMMGVYVVKKANGDLLFNVYTDKFFFKFGDSNKLSVEKNHIGMIPIIEYPSENARLGVFEPVMTVLDALDELQSNRMDDIVQFVNSFLAVFGAELDDATYKKLEEWKTLCLPEGTDARYLSGSLSQADVQTLKNDFHGAILTICGMPNRNGGSSTSDTGSAVILRDGWEAAEGRAKATEEMFKSSEMEFLKVALHILRKTVGTKLKLSDITIHFTRRNYDNIASKVQVLVAMLNNPKIHPELAFTHCGLFIDPESAYLQSMAYYEEQQKKWEPVEVEEEEDETDVSAS